MILLFKAALKGFLKLFKPVINWLFLRKPEQLAAYKARHKGVTLDGMVAEFNVWQRWIFLPFFRRVKYVDTDISRIKSIADPVVYVIKNQGQLEYRYFNYLFLKEKVGPVRHANSAMTLLWWPLRRIYEISLIYIDALYKGVRVEGAIDNTKEALLTKKNTFLSLSISRDYLFGLIRTNPSKSLIPIIEAQQQMDTPIKVVTLQFLYDKHPDKTEQSYFDLLFGEKSQPGAIRKVILFLMNYRRSPQVKFGDVIDLKSFVENATAQTVEDRSQALLDKIQSDLKISKASITGPKLDSKETTLKRIMKDEAFLGHIQTIAKQDDLTMDDAKSKAHRYLQEIAADVNYSYVQFGHITMKYIWNNIYDGVVVKHEQLNAIREKAGRNPVVLVPMHRSHIDYLLISDIFYEHNITFPYICAGINLNFWPVGRLIRKCGGFFIRRSFDGNKLYKESLYAYMKSLISTGHCLEFFIEGTRSRTGKLLKPKMGILSMLLRAFSEGAAEDIYFVPIAVNYDEIIEQNVYRKEGAGGEKKAEDAGELLKVRKIFNKKYGKVYIEFNEPISLKEYCEEQEVSKSALVEQRSAVKDFAYNITYNMNKVALVTPVSLVATAILSIQDKTFDFDRILERVELLKNYLDFKGVEYSDLINYSDRYAYNQAIQKFHGKGMIKEVETFEENFYMVDSKHRPSLDYYKNNILHFFVSLTTFLKVMNGYDNGQIVELEAIIKNFETVKSLLKQDFTFSERSAVEEHISRVAEFCFKRGLVEFDSKTKTVKKTLTKENYKQFMAFQGLLDNFLESHLIVLRYIRHNHFKELDQKVLNKEILTKGKPMYLKDELNHPEALSRFNLENSFKVFVDLGLLHKTQDGRKVLYSTLPEIEPVEKWIKTLQELLDSEGPIVSVAPAKSAEKSESSESSQSGFH